MRIDSIPLFLSLSLSLCIPIVAYVYRHILVRACAAFTCANTYTIVFTRSRGRVRLRRWRRVTSVPLLSDRTIEKFPRFFAFDHPGGASRSLIGPGRLVIPTREGVDGPCSLSRSLSRALGSSLPCTLYTLARYLSMLLILTSYRYRGHSSILYSLPLLFPTPFFCLAPFHPPRAFYRRPLRSRKFRLMNYMYNI